MTFKEIVKTRSKARGMTQGELARRIGVKGSSLSEALGRGRPTYDLLEKLAAALDCQPGDLLPHSDTLPDAMEINGTRYRKEEE